MTTYGVLPTGFVKKTLAICKSEREAAYRTAFGSGVNLVAPSLMATVIGIESGREASVWDIAEEAYYSRGPSSAQGVGLDNVGEITNDPRIPAAPSKVFSQLFFGASGTVIDSTFIGSVDGNAAAQFSPDQEYTLGDGVSAIQALTFSAVATTGNWKITLPDGQVTANIAFNADNTAIQNAVRLLSGWGDVVVSGSYGTAIALTFAGVSGLQPQAPIIGTGFTLLITSTPVTISQSDTAIGVSQATVTMVATAEGPTVADNGTLTVIDTPVTGITRIINTADAVLGRFVETDGEYRIRRKGDLQKTSSATTEAIRIAVKQVADVLECIVYENTSDVTDMNSVPPHSVHIYAAGGTDLAIAEAIFGVVGGGINTFGSTSVDITDSQGFTQTVNFDRPTQKSVYVVVTVTTDSDYPATGDMDIKNAIVAYGQGLKIGDDVLLYPKLLPAIVDNVVGITDITIAIGFSPGPSSDSNLTLAASELATFDTANISVSS